MVSLSKTKIALSSILFSLVLYTGIALAHCPLCTAAAGAAVAITRWYGVDDLVVGSFIGAFVISTGLWFNNILKRRNKGKDYLPFQSVILVLLSLISTIISFSLGGITTNSYFIFGIDKLIMGTLLGSGMTWLAFWFSKFLRKNMGRTLIPFQSIILTFAFLSLMNLSFYFVGLIK